MPGKRWKKGFSGNDTDTTSESHQHSLAAHSPLFGGVDVCRHLRSGRGWDQFGRCHCLYLPHLEIIYKWIKIAILTLKGTWLENWLGWGAHHSHQANVPVIHLLHLITRCSSPSNKEAPIRGSQAKSSDTPLAVIDVWQLLLITSHEIALRPVRHAASGWRSAHTYPSHPVSKQKAESRESTSSYSYVPKSCLSSCPFSSRSHWDLASPSCAAGHRQQHLPSWWPHIPGTRYRPLWHFVLWRCPEPRLAHLMESLVEWPWWSQFLQKYCSKLRFSRCFYHNPRLLDISTSTRTYTHKLFSLCNIMGC